MRLSQEQLQRLVEVLKPHFVTPAQRQQATQRATLGDVPADYLDTTQTTAEEFAWYVVNSLHDQQRPDGESALLSYLEHDLKETLEASPVREMEAEGVGSGSPDTPRSDSAYVRILSDIIESLRTPEITDDPLLGLELSTVSYTRMAPPVPPKSEQRRRKRRRTPLFRSVGSLVRLVPWSLVSVVLVVLITFPIAAMSFFASDAYARVQESYGSLRRVLSSLETTPLETITQSDFDRLNSAVRNFSGSLNNAQQQTSLLRRFTSVRADLVTTFQILDAASLVTGSAQDVLSGMQPVVSSLAAGEAAEALASRPMEGERMIELIQFGSDWFTRAEDKLRRADAILATMDITTLPPQAFDYYQQLVLYRNQIARAVRIAKGIPALLDRAFGVTEPINYLILSQNNDELRPSGGYISTFGWLRVREFDVTDLGYGGTSFTSPNPPPDSMVGEIARPDWWYTSQEPITTAWSGSWHADFRKTAELAAWYYNNGDNPRSPVQGVIGIDLMGMEYLMEPLGNIEVEGYDTVNSLNFREVVYNFREDTGIDHKDYLARLYRQLLNQFAELQEDRSPAMVGAFLRALENKHILLYFDDPELSALMDELGWSGAQTPGTGDYLMVADTNMGNKSNSSVQRELDYSVVINADGSLVNRLTMVYTYSALLAEADPAVRPAHYRNMKDYYSITQIFTPDGAQVGEVANLDNPLSTDSTEDMSIMIARLHIPYDSTRTYEINYTVPPVLEQVGNMRRYRLIIQKQAGTQNQPVRVQIQFPPESNIVRTSIDPTNSFQAEGPVLEFRLTMDTDKEIEILFQ